MNYNDFLGMYTVPSENEEKTLSNRPDLSIPDSEYENVRFGMPSGTVSFEKTKEERSLLIDHFLKSGYNTFPSKKLSISFKRHVSLFRASLDLWEQMTTGHSMSKDELYYRCLTEGPSFTEWVKKARAMSFVAATAETDVEIDEDYLLHNYSGYNSLLSERYFIHWDDTDEIDDIKYAFIPSERKRENDFRQMVRNLFDEHRISDLDASKEFDMIRGLKNSVMYDPKKKKSSLMREFWSEEIDASGPYFATRRVVPVHPSGTRDTGVGDPGTVLKVKQLNELCRLISERLPYSANAPSRVCNSRLKRVLKRNTFLHLDFKKFGLTFPRHLMNIVIEEMGEYLDIDTSHLIINDFFVEIDNETYKTSRGTMLGWLDCVNSIAVCAILFNLSVNEKLNFDFITFNDDVEISKFAKSDIKGTLELLRIAVVTELSSFDIPISLKKTFGSKCSVFLERYAYYSQYGIDMYKEQLTVKAYAQSLVSEFPWQAKMFFSAAEMWTKNSYATDRCISTCPEEFPIEVNSSLWSGGWFIRRKNGLDQSLIETTRIGYLLGLELAKFKNQIYSSTRTKTSTPDEIFMTVNNKAYESNSAELARNQFTDIPSMTEINSDIEYLKMSAETYFFLYQGRDVEFRTRIEALSRDKLRIDDPG